VALRSQAIASSAPLGTTFDASGQLGHILDPLTGAPAKPVWRSVSISAPSAALADALSTAACLMKDRAAVAAMAAAFDGVQVEAAVQA
jgi:thiamine biosynthesis lipoprotein